MSIPAAFFGEVEKGSSRPGSPELYTVVSIAFPDETRHYSYKAVHKLVEGDIGATVWPFLESIGELTLYSTTIQNNALTPREVRVSILDEQNVMASLIARYIETLNDCEATIATYTPNAIGSEAVWFVGKIKEISLREHGTYEFLFAMDIRPIEDTEIPHAKIGANLFPNAHDDALGKYLSPVYGYHDSDGIGSKGIIACPCVDTVLKRHLVSLGWVVGVPKVYVDEELQSSGYTIVKTVWRGYWMTFIDFDSDQSDKEVTCDVDGLDCDDAANPTTTTTNLFKIGRHMFANFFYEDWRSGPWYGDSAGHIDVPTWDDAETYADDRGFGASRKWRTDDQVKGSAEAKAFADTGEAKLSFGPDGNISVFILDPTSIDATNCYQDAWISEEDFKKPNPQPLRADLSGIRKRTLELSHLYSDAEEKYYFTLKTKNMNVQERTSESRSLAYNEARIA